MEGEARIRGTIYGYERFLASNIWQDMKNELNLLFQISTADYDRAKSMEEVAKVQGRREALVTCMELPQTILDGLRDAYVNKIDKEETENG